VSVYIFLYGPLSKDTMFIINFMKSFCSFEVRSVPYTLIHIHMYIYTKIFPQISLHKCYVVTLTHDMILRLYNPYTKSSTK